MIYKAPGTRGLVFKEPLIFERSRNGRKGYSLPDLDVEEANVPEKHKRKDQ